MVMQVAQAARRESMLRRHHGRLHTCSVYALTHAHGMWRHHHHRSAASQVHLVCVEDVSTLCAVLDHLLLDPNGVWCLWTLLSLTLYTLALLRDRTHRHGSQGVSRHIFQCEHIVSVTTFWYQRMHQVRVGAHCQVVRRCCTAHDACALHPAA